MATVFIPAPMRKLADGLAQVDLDVATVAEAIDELERRFPGIRDRLCTDGELRHSLRVSVDSSISPRGLRAKLQADSELHFVHAIGGG